MAFEPDTAFDLLRGAHEQKRLAHAYLISGPPDSGKRRLAANVASLVNGTPAKDVFGTAARDVFVIEPESRSRRIIIDQIRRLEHSLQMRSADGQRKVAIITDADRLQPQAANAFLKTLEEPPANSLLLLLTALPEVLLDTIISRCIPIQLAAASNGKGPSHDADLVEMLRSISTAKTWTVQDAYRLGQNLQRLLGTIKEEIRDETDEALKQEEARYRNTTDGSWLEEREDYYKALSESRYLERRARLIETLFVWWSDILRAKSGIGQRDLPQLEKETAKVAERFSMPDILNKIRRLEEMRDHLGRNIQEALSIEVAFLRVFAS